jgi:fucose permease
VEGVNRRLLTWTAYGGMFLFGIVMAIFGAVLPVLSKNLVFDLSQAGTLLLSMNGSMLVATLISGPSMDIYGKKPVLLLGACFVGIAMLLMAAASSVSLFLISMLVLGAGGAALNAATNTVIADLYSEERLRNAALNLLGVFFGFGAIFIPFSMGALLETAGLAAILYSAAVLCALSAVSVLVLQFPPLAPPAHRTESRVRDPLLIAFALLLFFQSGNEFVLGGYASLFLMRELSMPVALASYMLAAYWAALMLARVALSRILLRFPGEQVVLVSALLVTITVLLLASAQNWTWAISALVFVGASGASIFPTTLGVAGNRYGERLGTVFGLLIGTALCGGMLMPLVVGRMADATNMRNALVVPAGNALVIASLMYYISRHTRSKAVS